MKLLLNDYGINTNKRRQELPGNTLVEFYSDDGDKFAITQLEDGKGINVRLVRKHGFDQLVVYPRMANDVEIR